MSTAEAQGRPPRIVVGVDGSESSEAALRWAARLAPALGAVIEAVIAWQDPSRYGWTALVSQDWHPDEDAAGVLEQSLANAFDADRPPGLVATTREGHAGKVLLEVSEDAAMLIVGSRGHGGFAGLLLGSVSTACAEHSHCPVLVVHQQPGK